MKHGIAIAAACLLAGCGSPQRLPVALSLCSAVHQPQGLTIVATVENKSTVPIANLALSASFYQDFRYQSYSASSRVQPALDPGQKRSIAFSVEPAQGSQPSGEAIRCFVTHIGYLDGTAQNAPSPSGP